MLGGAARCNLVSARLLLQSLHMILNHFPFLRIPSAFPTSNGGPSGSVWRAQMPDGFLPRFMSHSEGVGHLTSPPACKSGPILAPMAGVELTFILASANSRPPEATINALRSAAVVLEEV